MIHPRITLVTADYIATTRGVSVETVNNLVDGVGAANESFTWVFNVAANLNVKRELRFWSREVDKSALKLFTAELDLDRVIAAIVPRRDSLPGQFCGLRNWEVGDLLRVSRRTLIDLRDELHAVPHNGGIYVPRAALEDFFRRRWVFANVPTNRALAAK